MSQYLSTLGYVTVHIVSVTIYVLEELLKNLKMKVIFVQFYGLELNLFSSDSDL